METGKKIRSVGELFVDSWNAFRENWKKIVSFELVSFLLMIPPFALLIISLGLTTAKYPELRDYVFANPSVPSQVNPGALKFLISFFTQPLSLLGFVLLVLVSIIYNLGFYRTVVKVIDKEETTLVENFKYAFSNFWSYLFISLVAGLILLAGIVLFVVPGLVVAVLFSMFPFVYIVAGNHKLNALKQSKELVQKYFWAVAGRMFVVVLFTTLISNILSDTHSSSAINLIFLLLNIVYSIILPGFMAAYFYFIYKDVTATNK
jgi:hypothetical protein